jgi:hypothetical protein
MPQSFFSDLHNRLVIDDSNFQKYVQPVIDGDVRFRGYKPRDWNAEPYGSSGVAVPMSMPLIPRTEWVERIRDINKAKGLLSQRRKQAGIGPFNQQNTNFCWGNGVLKCFQILRMLQGEDFVDLSPASICCMITNFQNVGGWGTQFLKYLNLKGAVPAQFWPHNAINRKYNTAETMAMRAKFRVPDGGWYDIDPRQSFDATMTLVLLGIPVAVAYNWWGHLVLAEDPIVDKDGRFGLGELNSWGPWGENGDGTFVLMEGKGTPSEAVAPALAV